MKQQGLTHHTDSRFRALLGKRVELTYKGEKRCGVLNFAGFNKMVHDEFQVTLGRTPLWPVDMNSIQLAAPRKILFRK